MPTVLVPGDVAVRLRIRREGCEVTNPEMDLNFFTCSSLQFAFGCHFIMDSETSTASMNVVIKAPNARLHLTPIYPLKVMPGALSTDLFQRMLMKNECKRTPEYGLVVIDRSRSCLLLHLDDPKAKELPAAGLWISNVDGVRDVAVFVAIQAFYSTFKIAAESVVLILFGKQQRTPKFYDCMMDLGDMVSFQDSVDRLALFPANPSSADVIAISFRPLLPSSSSEANQNVKTETLKARKDLIQEEPEPTKQVPAEIPEPSTTPTSTVVPSMPIFPPQAFMMQQPELYLALLQQQMDLMRLQLGAQQNRRPEKPQKQCESVGTNTTFIAPMPRILNASTNTSFLQPPVQAVPQCSTIEHGVQTTPPPPPTVVDETMTAKELNLPTQVPSIMQAFDQHSMPPGTSTHEYEPLYPQPSSVNENVTNDWLRRTEHMDSDERRFLESGMNWAGEGFTRYSIFW
jgi:hypothetical protein